MNSLEIKQLPKLSSMSSFGSNQSFEAEVCMDSNLFDELSEDAKDTINYEAVDFLQKLNDKIYMEWVKENKKEEREAHIDKLKNLFKEACFEPIYVKVIDNQYSNHPVYFTMPWLEVTTIKGLIKIGWRKRVINLDWSESDIDVDAESIFAQENVTKGDKLIHCWGYEKAIEYLIKLNNER